MEEEVSTKIFGLPGLLAVDMTKHRQETASLRREMHAGLDGIDRRFDRLETRVEVVETKVDNLETKVVVLETKIDAIGGELHDFRGKFELRIAPLER